MDAFECFPAMCNKKSRAYINMHILIFLSAIVFLQKPPYFWSIFSLNQINKYATIKPYTLITHCWQKNTTYDMLKGQIQRISKMIKSSANDECNVWVTHLNDHQNELRANPWHTNTHCMPIACPCFVLLPERSIERTRLIQTLHRLATFMFFHRHVYFV